MTCGELAAPEAGCGEVLVRIHAAAMNRVDKWVRDGWAGLRLAMPHVLGSDGAGVVAAVGEGVQSFKVGDRVVINSNIGCGECHHCLSGQDNICARWELLGETIRGTNAEYVVVPERQLLSLPPAISFETASAAALVFVTAWHSLITRGQLAAGEQVLVVGAGGGVNTAAIQIAKRAGCVVYVVGSDEHKLARAQALGADMLIDRSKEDWSKKVYQLTAKHGVDVVVDNVGAATFMQSMRAARKGGRILTVGNTSGAKFEFDNRYLFGKQLSLIGSTMGTRADFETVMRRVFNGDYQVPIDSIFPLAEVQAAHRKMESGDLFGKIVLIP